MNSTSIFVLNFKPQKVNFEGPVNPVCAPRLEIIKLVLSDLDSRGGFLN